VADENDRLPGGGAADRDDVVDVELRGAAEAPNLQGLCRRRFLLGLRSGLLPHSLLNPTVMMLSVLNYHRELQFLDYHICVINRDSITFWTLIAARIFWWTRMTRKLERRTGRENWIQIFSTFRHRKSLNCHRRRHCAYQPVSSLSQPVSSLLSRSFSRRLFPSFLPQRRRNTRRPCS
jgi:hypothetical protein